MARKTTKKKAEIIEATSEPECALVEYTNVNFDDLNKSITQLGQYKGRLTKEEKKIGADLLDEWKSNVCSRIDNKIRELRTVEEFLGITSGSYQKDFTGNESQILRDNMAHISNTGKEYQAWMDTYSAIELNKLEQPQRTPYNPELSEVENDKAYAKFKEQEISWEITDKKLKYKERKAWQSWMFAIRKSKNIKQFITKISAYKKQLENYKDDCRTKTHLAKVNIAISNDDVRASIQEILEFSEKFRPLR